MSVDTCQHPSHPRRAKCSLTLFKSWHGQDTTEHSLVVTIEQTTQTGKGGNSEDLEVLEDGSGPGSTHQGLTSLEGMIESRIIPRIGLPFCRCRSFGHACDLLQLPHNAGSNGVQGRETSVWRDTPRTW